MNIEKCTIDSITLIQQSTLTTGLFILDRTDEYLQEIFDYLTFTKPNETDKCCVKLRSLSELKFKAFNAFPRENHSINQREIVFLTSDDRTVMLRDLLISPNLFE